MIFCGLVRCSGFVVWMVKFLDCMGCWVVVFMDVMMDRCLFVWLDWTGLASLSTLMIAYIPFSLVFGMNGFCLVPCFSAIFLSL